MLDSNFREPFHKILVVPVLNTGFLNRIHPSTLTLLGLIFGMLVVPALYFQMKILALGLLWSSGYLDMLDGSLARHQGTTGAKGCVLDIVSDRMVEFSIVLGLFLVDPTERGLVCMFMLGSILLCITSFLVVGIFSTNHSEKSFHYSPGLIERGEAFTFFSVMILFPESFFLLGSVFFLLVTSTGLLRIKAFAEITP